MSAVSRINCRWTLQATERFHAALAAYYAGTPERLRYVEYPGVGHDVPEDAASAMRQRMVDWFQQQLT